MTRRFFLIRLALDMVFLILMEFFQMIKLMTHYFLGLEESQRKSRQVDRNADRQTGVYAGWVER
jgi:hypothetical protein